MKIRLNDNAASNYVTRCYKGAHPACGRLHNEEFAGMLKKVQGKWLKVETDHLFNDQFNTAPIKGVTALGLRVMHADVAEIKGDIRKGIKKCRWCYGYDRENKGICDKCGSAEHLEEMKPLKIF